MSRRRALAVRKQQLISRIERQRADLGDNKAQWLDKTEHIDRGYQALFGMRKYLLLGSGVVALYGMRHPSKLIRWSRRAFSAWGTVRLLRKTLSH
ncbi:MAG: cell division protein FtsH [Serratia rubidaea]|nr:cell division protein FtsH [Serratia rubidaea]